jgi:hypothetical protein
MFIVIGYRGVNIADIGGNVKFGFFTFGNFCSVGEIAMPIVVIIVAGR